MNRSVGYFVSGLEFGRLNFTSSPNSSINSGEIVTLVDANPGQTLATPGNRPTENAGDTYLGTDSGSVNYPSVGLAVVAPVSISEYINATPDGASYNERLTVSAKTFNVPVTANGNVTVNGQLLVAGPWMVTSPFPAAAMATAGAGTSALGISNDGNFYISANGGAPQEVATSATSSYCSNLFQEDANDLGEYNGINPQSRLHLLG